MNLKRFSALILAFLFLFVGCASTAMVETSGKPAQDAPQNAGQNEKPADPANTDNSGTDAGILVVYFSRTGEQYRVGVIDKGNTAVVAEMIAEENGADMFELVPAEDTYPDTYDALTDAAKQEQNEGARPAYRDDVPDLTQYATVFVGAPVWWGDWPMILYTFFETEDLSGKTLIPFSTHEGSGLSGFDKKLASACPDSEVLAGLAVRGEDCQTKQDDVRASVRGWLAGLGY